MTEAIEHLLSNNEAGFKPQYIHKLKKKTKKDLMCQGP
jgi:hypothetical protein